ncbi:Nitrogen permease regulator 2 [Wickerhamomyces ciferrii]|uniref:Nitrogen permease regulator 2 n=1 Tax=Wickerhamomyces ciferrii (strain ATCC 14091 / BCRC 22168 / CBS 111 / JCM 3599 / NBRC 0793 / NRRL Y-1031 F-60-10) TaxID=1206466 RepID=K0KBS6_WICCF|nr:Nitrogen permease regulator 2 [Wickerhamomyces ciferrii]CCH42515.1 Nitrogen permease regulator 2 [Wickerhamomyces ciferrii]
MNLWGNRSFYKRFVTSAVLLEFSKALQISGVRLSKISSVKLPIRFSPIEAIFYTVFHPTEGTKVSQQVPLGSIVTPAKTTSDVLNEPLIDFGLVKNYVIPKPQLCNRLISLKVGNYRIIGYPVNTIAPYYARNSFSFNLCFVFKYGSDTTPYESSIKRLGQMFKNLEEQYQLFSRKERDHLYFKDENRNTSTNTSAGLTSGTNSKDGRVNSTAVDNNSDDVNKLTSITYLQILNDLNNDIDSSTPLGIVHREGYTIKLDSIESLIQQIYQDLNNYSECLIPIDSGNSVDIKLFPLLPPPPKLSQEDVPISTVRLESMVDLNWDPTMLKILPFINGVNSIKKISSLANADYWIVKQCIQHLIYYKCIIIIDIFQFSNIYAPTSDIDLFLKDSNMANECQAYVVSPSIFKDRPYQTDSTNSNNFNLKNVDSNKKNDANRNKSSSTLNLNAKRGKNELILLPSKAKLFYLYRSLHQGQSVKNWYKDHITELEYIDVRRFLSFGVLRGLIYRVHSYPIIDSVILNDQDQDVRNKYNPWSNSTSKTSNTSDGDEDDEEDEEEEGEEEEDEELDSDNSESDEVAPKTLIPKSKPRNPLFKRNSSMSQNDNFSKDQKEKIAIIVKSIKSSKNFDAICTELEMDKKSVEALMRKIGHFNVVNS